MKRFLRPTRHEGFAFDGAQTREIAKEMIRAVVVRSHVRQEGEIPLGAQMRRWNDDEARKMGKKWEQES
jgi:hypothetical protein